MKNLYNFLLSLCLLLLSATVVGQAEVFVNLLEGEPLPLNSPIIVQDDKLDYAGSTPEMDDVEYIDNRLLLAFYPGDGQTTMPAGVYTVDLDVKIWTNGTPPTSSADIGFIRTMTVTVDPNSREQARAQYATDQVGRKMEVKVMGISYNDGTGTVPLPNDPPRMQLIAEIALERDFCALDLNTTPDADVFDVTDGGDEAVARVERIACADEYDFEYVFYDEDSQYGKILADQAAGNVSVSTLFKNNATRLTSTDLNYRLFHLYR
ncbi:MAG: hypothetical protein AAGA31_15965, partial [Bacteroidota bacterium]